MSFQSYAVWPASPTKESSQKFEYFNAVPAQVKGDSVSRKETLVNGPRYTTTEKPTQINSLQKETEKRTKHEEGQDAETFESSRSLFSQGTEAFMSCKSHISMETDRQSRPYLKRTTEKQHQTIPLELIASLCFTTRNKKTRKPTEITANAGEITNLTKNPSTNAQQFNQVPATIKPDFVIIVSDGKRWLMVLPTTKDCIFNNSPLIGAAIKIDLALKEQQLSSINAFIIDYRALQLPTLRQIQSLCLAMENKQKNGESKTNFCSKAWNFLKNY